MLNRFDVTFATRFAIRSVQQDGGATVRPLAETSGVTADG